MERIYQAKLITAIKTPYREDRKIDFEAFDRHVQLQIDGGVQGLVLGGTTGEGHLMDWQEHVSLIAHAVNLFGEQLVMIGNTGSNNTHEAIRATEEGFAVGMHMSLQVNPYYGKTSQGGLLEHFQRVLDLGPALIYNVPGRTGQDLQPELIRQLAKHPHMIGVKECAGIERIKGYEAEGIACWSGNDDDCHDSRHQAGSHGVITVAGNLLPKTWRYLMDQEDQSFNQSLKPFIEWLFHEPNPICLNTLMPMLGYCKPVFRLPYCPLDEASRRKGKELLEGIDLKDQLPEIQLLLDEAYQLIA